MLCILSKIFSRQHLKYFFLFIFFFSIWDNLHEMSKPVSGKSKKNIINLSAEWAQRVVMAFWGANSVKTNFTSLLKKICSKLSVGANYFCLEMTPLRRDVSCILCRQEKVTSMRHFKWTYNRCFCREKGNTFSRAINSTLVLLCSTRQVL